jgi:hypothetical protein
MGSADDPAISYSTAPLHNLVEDANRRLQDGSASLTFEGRSGYLASVIDLLKLPRDSQLLLFSRGSLQGKLIGPTNPRALFFSDRTVLGWVRDAPLIEIAAGDERSGIVFYTLEQRPTARPTFTREFRCLGCHLNGDTLGVPGLLMFSEVPDPLDQQIRMVTTDQRTRLAERWGGWFVTGDSGAARHRGNQVPERAVHPAGPIASVAGLFDTDGYPETSSDIAALLTFSHQIHMTNLLTRASWEARAADPAAHPQPPATPDASRSPGESAADQAQLVNAMLRGVADEVVDYMLFIGEAPLPSPVVSGSGFATRMAGSGARDRRGRSLYELDLKTRLMKYPCSYLIYSQAFDALPPLAKTPIYERLWQVLSGDAPDLRYQSLSLSDRRAIVEILRDTKPDLPRYFGAVTK